MNASNLSFIDTNVLIYAFDVSTNEKHRKASKLLEELWMGENGCISVQVLQELYVNITRNAPNALNPDQALSIIRDLSNWKVHRPGVQDVLAAISVQQQFQISFWDAMIIRSAQESYCSILWSEDLSNGQDYGGVIVVNPFL